MAKRLSTMVMLYAHYNGDTNKIPNFSLLMFVIGLFCLTAIGTWGARTIYFSYQNTQLQKQLSELETRHTEFKDRVHAIIQDEKKNRVVVGLPDVHPDIRQVGIGGPANENLWHENLDSPVSRSLILQSELDKLDRETVLSIASLQEIKSQAITTQDQWDHTPTIIPVSGVVTSRYGTRKDPFTGMLRMHKGIDIAAYPGTLVWATANGIVTKAGVDPRYGRFIDIDHLNGLMTRFGHLSSILVNRGDRINRGDAIGKIGDTGRANGYHLHYEVHLYGNRINPQQYFWPEEKIVN